MEEQVKRGPGRPKKYVEEAMRLDVRVGEDVHRRVRVAAAERNVRLGEWVTEAIEEKLARERGEADARSGN